MKTFDEVIRKLCHKDNVTNENIERLQAAFRIDIESSELAHIFAESVWEMLSVTTQCPHCIARDAYLNGLMLGVAIGVEMEKQELDT